MSMTAPPEKRLLAVISAALTNMALSPKSARETTALCVLAAIVLDGWVIEPDTEAIGRLQVCLGEGIGLSAPSDKPADVAQHRKALAEAVILHLGKAGWLIEEPATLRRPA